MTTTIENDLMTADRAGLAAARIRSAQDGITLAVQALVTGGRELEARHEAQAALNEAQWALSAALKLADEIREFHWETAIAAGHVE